MLRSKRVLRRILQVLRPILEVRFRHVETHFGGCVFLVVVNRCREWGGGVFVFDCQRGLSHFGRRQMVAWDLDHWVLAGAGSPGK